MQFNALGFWCMKFYAYELIALLAVIVFSAWLGYLAGYRVFKNKLPSCLYLDRPLQNGVKPWGCDNKEGIDWHYDQIAGGGIYVDLSKWKCAK